MQKVLLGAAILAMSNAQFEDNEPLDFSEEEQPVEPVAAKPLNVSDLTVDIEKQGDICKKDFEQYMDGLNWQQKMKIAMKAMAMIKDVQTVGAETIYTADEAAHRLRHCATLKDQQQRNLCKQMGAKLIRTGPINYMTFKGKRAFSDMCKIQSNIPSCQKQCDLTHQFFKAPAEEDCSKLQEGWQEECGKVARGELVYREPTEEDKEQLRANRRAIKECRREHDEYQTQCANQLQSHLDRILAKKGNVKKSVTQKIGKCFYRSIRNFTQCVKKAPEVPEGMEFEDVGGEKKNPLADILGGLMKEMSKKNRRRGGRGGGWGGRQSGRQNRRRGGRGRGRRQVEPPAEPVVVAEREDSIDFEGGDDGN